MITVSIHGSCVSRGLFDISEFGKAQFEVKEYIAKNNIFSLFSDKTEIENIKKVSDPHSLDWNTRMVYYDSQKLVFDALSNSESDYLIIDLIDQRLGMITDKNRKRILTNSESLKRMNVYDKIDMPNNISIHSFNYSETYKHFLQYALAIKQIYHPKQIFIIEAFPVMAYYNKNGSIQFFNEENVKKSIDMRKMLDMQYSILEEVLDGSYVIKFPNQIIGKEDHKFGLASTHFETDYYDIVSRRIYSIIRCKMA